MHVQVFILTFTVDGNILKSPFLFNTLRTGDADLRF